MPATLFKLLLDLCTVLYLRAPDSTGVDKDGEGRRDPHHGADDQPVAPRRLNISRIF